MVAGSLGARVGVAAGAAIEGRASGDASPVGFSVAGGDADIGPDVLADGFGALEAGATGSLGTLVGAIFIFGMGSEDGISDDALLVGLSMV